MGLSLAAQGLWIRMLMVMHDSPKKGYLITANGMQMVETNGMQTSDANAMQTPCKTILHDANGMQNACKILAAVVGRSEAEIKLLLQEMKALGTFSTDSDGTIYCRRMVKNTPLSEKRRQAANKRWGARCKQHANDANDASSSSFSSSLEEAKASSYAKSSDFAGQPDAKKPHRLEAVPEGFAEWAEERYTAHPKPGYKLKAIAAMRKHFAHNPQDRAVFTRNHKLWVQYWNRRGEAEFVPALVRADGSGFIPDEQWRKPPPGYAEEPKRQPQKAWEPQR